jgi:hypothetical protein
MIHTGGWLKQENNYEKNTRNHRNIILSLRENQESDTLDILNTVGVGEKTNQEPVERGEKTSFQEILMVTGIEMLVLSIV